ncbi:histidinol-phosphate transaminase [Neptunicoccus sediminis]|uniref:histidinol-phosphate transaminase n=1 Tax=Neptunicoccus sediminis TaxID=1892596 RepID=UPI000845D86C|nr:histidinol-phosphate transaminase [Neptunicoccus sediminis]
MTARIQPQPGIMDIELYVGGKAHVDGVSNTVKLSSNENPWGASEKAKQAYRSVAGNLHVYPSSDHSALRAAIAKVHDLDAERIICCNGSDELISFLCQAYAGTGDEVLFTEHGFLMYKLCAQAAGATPVSVRETERTTDVDALLDAANENTKLVFIANPNNPTGTMISEAEVARLADGLPEQALLVLDGAYAEFVEGFDGHAALVEQRDNIFMTRTFSKIYGLGGVRMGWGYGPAEIVNTLQRVRGPFNVNAGALAAAEAAMLDVDYTAKCQDLNSQWRDYLQTELTALGIACDPSLGNFVLARFGSEAEADAADRALGAEGLIVRAVKSYGLPECLRITVGKGADCKRVIAVLSVFKEGWEE